LSAHSIHHTPQSLISTSLFTLYATMETTGLTSECPTSPIKQEVTGTTHPLSATTPPNERSHLTRFSSQKVKVALHRHLPYFEVLVHGLALAIIARLLFVNIERYFWKDFSPRTQDRRNVELKAWHYAARVHELLMMSLSFIVFTYMRNLLVGRRGITFGLLSAPHTIASPITLAKKKFWIGFVRNPAYGSLVVACILSVALGPSSAITMIPSLGWSDMINALSVDNSTIYYSSAHDEVWPTTVNISSTGLNDTEVARCLNSPFSLTSLYCPTAGYMDVLKWVCFLRIAQWVSLIIHVVKFVSYMATGARNELLFTDLYGGVQREVSIATDSNEGEGTESYVTVVSELVSRSLGTCFKLRATEEDWCHR
jgi:hypothetical protein